MRVGITIDGVIRDFITKFESVYDKYNPLPLEEGEEESVETPERNIIFSLSESLSYSDKFFSSRLD